MHAWYINTRREQNDIEITSHRRLGTNSDFVAIYHSSGSDWDNILTSSRLVDICNAEQQFLASQHCLGSDASSVLHNIFNADCKYKISFENSLLLLGSPNNAVYVEDGINSLSPQSSVLLSFYSTSCSLTLSSVENSVTKVEKSVRPISISYAQNKLIIDAFIQSGIHDFELSMIAMVICLAVLSLTLGFRFMFAILFLLTVISSLIISASILPWFGYSLFSVFNVLAIFVITGVGADFVIVFAKAWQKQIAQQKMSNNDYLQTVSIGTTTNIVADQQTLLNLSSASLEEAYASVIIALIFSVTTTILSFMANLVSPIIVISQLGAFMGIAMVFFFLMLHTILIPAWVVVILNQQKLNIMDLRCGIACRNTESNSKSNSRNENNCEVINGSRSKRWGCGVLMSTLLTTVAVMVGISHTTSTDFGLPMLFKEGDNIADLILIAKKFKSDILTLSSKDNSGVTSSDPPTTHNSPSHVPTTYPQFNTPSRYPSFPPISSQVPSSTPPTNSQAPTTQYQIPAAKISGSTSYTVQICYGIGIEKDYLDSDATARIDAATFSSYVEQGFMTDIEKFCDFAATHRNTLELTTSDTNCIFNQLMNITSESISVHDRIKLWMNENRAERFRHVGVEKSPGGVGTGNFGESNNLSLSWMCFDVSCRANVSSFLSNPVHALNIIQRWKHVVYGIGSDSAREKHVATLIGSDSWLFPLLSTQLVQSIHISATISLVGTFSLLVLMTRNISISLLIVLGMVVVLLDTVLLHTLIFSSVIDLIDIVVLISFVGIIVDYPTHMAFHYNYALILKRKESQRDNCRLECQNTSTQRKFENNIELDDDFFARKTFGYMRKTLVGPVLTTLSSAVPLIFADFTLISKAGEYVLLMSVVTYTYVALVMPALLRLVVGINACAGDYFAVISWLKSWQKTPETENCSN